MSETFFILRRTERCMIKKLYWCSCKVPFILVLFWWNLNILDRFSKNTQISNFMKLRPVGAELFHANGRTDMMKLIATFRNFANAPKSYKSCKFLLALNSNCIHSYFISLHDLRRFILESVTILWELALLLLPSPYIFFSQIIIHWSFQHLTLYSPTYQQQL